MLTYAKGVLCLPKTCSFFFLWSIFEKSTLNDQLVESIGKQSTLIFLFIYTQILIREYATKKQAKPTQILKHSLFTQNKHSKFNDQKILLLDDRSKIKINPKKSK